MNKTKRKLDLECVLTTRIVEGEKVKVNGRMKRLPNTWRWVICIWDKATHTFDGECASVNEAIAEAKQIAEKLGIELNTSYRETT